MEPKSSRDLPGPKPRKDKERENQKAAAKTPDKTNDWDRNQVHGEGESIGIDKDEPYADPHPRARNLSRPRCGLPPSRPLECWRRERLSSSHLNN
ncbi:hypothetical protein CK222_12065 [Mesorhizobium sp. WSM3866]|nr:hypothetical protein CK222_12065 [Mesorhizobium sp. WSM3866]